MIGLYYANVPGSLSTQNSHKWTQSAAWTARLESSFTVFTSEIRLRICHSESVCKFVIVKMLSIVRMSLMVKTTKYNAKAIGTYSHH